MQNHFVILCYTCSMLCSDPLRRHGASYKLFFIVGIFNVRKCSLKVWGSKQLLSWVAEQCFGHELVIHCKWFLQLFRIGFAVSVKVHDRYIGPYSTNEIMICRLANAPFCHNMENREKPCTFPDTVCDWSREQYRWYDTKRNTSNPDSNKS